MKKYRRIEVNAYRRRVTVVSGEWPRDSVAALAQAGEEVSLNDADQCEPIEPDSPEGQLILAEAMLSLQRRLSPETQAATCGVEVSSDLNPANHNVLFRRLQAFSQFIWPKSLRPGAKG